MAHLNCFYIFILLNGILLKFSKCCTSDSQRLHVCLNIYLERDYPSVEAILKAQIQSSKESRGGQVLMEGPDLSSICQKIDSLQNCLSEVAEECDTYWHIYRFDRMMRSLLALYNLLCANSKDGLKAVLTYAMCIRNIEYVKNCEEESFHWDTIWKQMLRLQIDDEICEPLDRQKKCVVAWLESHRKCGIQASYVYNLTISTWLQAWCSASCKIKSSTILLIISSFIASHNFLSHH
ncbi:uncharacterized protein [Centruroides vittatus]|uniref:uncharacterized protein n=1 Tax=Centruroides vittatus TaxID=120091 RepID=UPI00350F3117